MTAAFVILSAIALDWMIGEPRRFHPLVLFGSIAERSERIGELGAFQRISPFERGLICWLFLVVPPTFGVWLLINWLPAPWQWILDCLILYFTIGWKSMQEHAMEVHRNLIKGDMNRARRSVGKIVSRETQELNERDMAKGAVEAVLENGSDCVLSPLFWYLLLGAPGAFMFRLANTLDAMWGNRSDRYIDFGRSAAKIDDFLNWVPARLTAVGYAICGRFYSACFCMKHQKAPTEGPNAGLVMAAGAGALEIKLGGPVIYHGQLDQRPVLGIGREVESQDIIRSIRLVWRTIGFWILFAAAVLAFLFLAGGYFET